MAHFHKIAPCLWFDQQAEPAAHFYVGIFKDARILQTTRYGHAGHDIHGMAAGTVMTVEFELAGQRFTALNGGPVFTFSEAVSLQVYCEDQQELDYYWAQLSDGGDVSAQQCGWLKDQFGVSWQIVPTVMQRMITDAEPEKGERVMAAMLQMKKLDIAGLLRAYDGHG